MGLLASRILLLFYIYYHLHNIEIYLCCFLGWPSTWRMRNVARTLTL